MHAETVPSIAATILQQLGGNRFLAMTGAKNLMSSERSLTMRLNSRLTQGVQWVKVTLADNDTYIVESLNRAAMVRERSELVYADALRSTFTKLTGLETSL